MTGWNGRNVREEIPASLAGERVDRVVALLTGRPRAEVATLIESGAVEVGGRVVTKPSRRLRDGEVLAVDVPERREPERPAPDPSVAFEVVFADDDVIVVDKPAHLVVHPGSGNREGTLVSGLLARFPDLGELDTGDPDRPGIVHRLDAGTSGLLVVARTKPAYESLVGQLAERKVGRHYLALVLGHVEPASGLIDAPVGRSASDPTRMAVTASGREARTQYEVLATYRDPVAVCELSCRLETGRTHQIRVHLAAIGHPVVGDERYGGARPVFAIDRPYLHATELTFDHPRSGERLRFESPLPADLLALRGRLS